MLYEKTQKLATTWVVANNCIISICVVVNPQCLSIYVIYIFVNFICVCNSSLMKRSFFFTNPWVEIREQLDIYSIRIILKFIQKSSYLLDRHLYIKMCFNVSFLLYKLKTINIIVLLNSYIQEQSIYLKKVSWL